MWSYMEKVFVPNQGLEQNLPSQLPEGSNPADISIWVLQPPELYSHKFLSFKKKKKSITICQWYSSALYWSDFQSYQGYRKTYHVYPMSLNTLGEQASEFEKHDCKDTGFLVEMKCKPFPYRAEKFFWRGLSNEERVLCFSSYCLWLPSLLLLKLQYKHHGWIAFSEVLLSIPETEWYCKQKLF